MRKALRAVVVAALIALPLGIGGAPKAQAACDPVGPLVICNEGMGSIGLDIPGLIHLCIKIQSLCG